VNKLFKIWYPGSLSLCSGFRVCNVIDRMILLGGPPRLAGEAAFSSVVKKNFKNVSSHSLGRFLKARVINWYINDIYWDGRDGYAVTLIVLGDRCRQEPISVGVCGCNIYLTGFSRTYLQKSS